MDWLALLRRAAPALLVIGIIWFAMHLKSNYDAAILRADRAELAQQAAETNRDQWKATADTQTKAVEKLASNLEAMEHAMDRRDARFAEEWKDARQLIARTNGAAQQLINAPAAPADQAVDVARAKLKDTADALRPLDLP